jgi:hypothetical protein
MAPALAAWALLAAKAVASVVYIRARLRLDRDQPASRAPGFLPNRGPSRSPSRWRSSAGALARSAGLRHPPRARRARLSPGTGVCARRSSGFTELAYGTLTALLLWIGYAAMSESGRSGPSPRAQPVHDDGPDPEGAGRGAQREGVIEVLRSSRTVSSTSRASRTCT